MSNSVYVYGIIPSADVEQCPQAPGLGEPSSPVRTLVEDGMAALVSDLPEDKIPGTAKDLEDHHRVLAEVIERCTAVPMRFGIVMDGDERVRQRLLQRHATVLSDVLHRLEGHVQMTVKAYFIGDELLNEALSDQPELAREAAALAQLPETQATQSARIRIGELIAKAVEARRAEIQATLLERLSRFADDVRVDPATDERVAFNAHLLVPRDQRAALDEEIRVLSEATADALAFRYIGPLAPYAFADLSLVEDQVQQQEPSAVGRE